MANIRLSCYEFRSYRAKNDEVSINLQAYLIVDSCDNGHIGNFFDKPVATLCMPSGKAVDLQPEWTIEREFKSGPPDLYTLRLSARVAVADFQPGLSKLCIRHATCWRPDDCRYNHEHEAIIRPLGNPKSDGWVHPPDDVYANDPVADKGAGNQP